MSCLWKRRHQHNAKLGERVERADQCLIRSTQRQLRSSL